ncbi:MAG TPA: hypothetical protein VM914_03680 [Pyrinomonadaceae bacterium]|jgi:hypothetical protein|nr:hypothetical protein [Pyrinomonadaceae bacterium]
MLNHFFTLRRPLGRYTKEHFVIPLIVGVVILILFDTFIDLAFDHQLHGRQPAARHDGRRREARARYAIFYLIPIAGHCNMVAKYSVYDFAEGWNFHFPVYDGLHFSARELFENRLRLIKEIDVHNYRGMMKGQYQYS